MNICNCNSASEEPCGACMDAQDMATDIDTEASLLMTRLDEIPEFVSVALGENPDYYKAELAEAITLSRPSSVYVVITEVVREYAEEIIAEIVEERRISPSQAVEAIIRKYK